MPRLSKIGAAALAAFGWTGLQTVDADFLVIAGGGGAGSAFGGGGGAGGYRCSVTGESSGGGASAETKLVLNPTQSYTVTVGAGGTGSTGSGTNGGNSVLSTITSTGGGYGGGAAAGGSGGSGGGAGSFGGASTFAAASGTANQGYAGGQNTGSANYGTGGGGGAGAVGGTGTTTVVGSGGNGVSSSITGSSVPRAGGGGGAGGVGFITTAGSGGSGGGGAGGSGGAAGTAGTANTGGGGGAGSYSGATWASGANGGSGIVIVSYTSATQLFGGGTVTQSGGKYIHTFTSSGALSPLSQLSASLLVVAGGGGGGSLLGGGGGAGGYRTGSGITIDTNSIYVVTVGAGGAGAIASGNGLLVGAKGSSSTFLAITSAGGGQGGSNNATLEGQFGGGGSGGSGGGAGPRGSISAAAGNTPSTSPSQGNNGGIQGTFTVNGGSGGGGASAVGGNLSGTAAGTGGAGTANSISGSSVTYAGGGGGGGRTSLGGTAGAGGAGGGGSGTGDNSNGGAGTDGLGGGGGGGGFNGTEPGGGGGNGGSGVVIISYPGSTQQMAGGTVTVAGGNVIHTFTSSGYLAPLFSANNSLRFRASASAYLDRTFPSAGNRKTYTLSLWVKRGNLGGSANQFFFSSGVSTTAGGFYFLPTDNIEINPRVNNTNITTTQVFRDPSAWYHIVVALDTTQATDSNRLKLYINGVQVTALSTAVYPALNGDSTLNNNIAHWIGRYPEPGFPSPFDGYLAEYNFIDGQALTPNSFGTFNGLGVWQPIRYGGSYGTNGFYLKFTDTTSTTTLGYDSSPNSNNWTTNNISLTTGTTYDSMTDVPTLTSATAANYGVYNPLNKFSATTISNGNLLVTNGSSGDGWSTTGSTFAFPPTGKWYAEFTIVNRPFSGSTGIGIVPSNINFLNQSGDSARFAWGRVYFDNSGIIGPSNASVQNTSQAPTYTTGDIISVAFDSDNGTVWWAKNGTWTNSGNPATGTNPAYTGLTATAYPMGFVITSEGYSSSQISGNWGQLPFTYTPPSGFVRMNTFNIANPTIGATASTQAINYMGATTYSGDSTSNRVITTGGGSDFVWIKRRNSSTNNILFDVLRGAGATLYSNLTNAEAANGSYYVQTFGNTGFTLGTGGDAADNITGGTYVAWNWKANGAGVTNTNGSINSTVSANTTAGFSIVTYTGNGTGGATVGHGLGVAPSMIILKRRNGTSNWTVGHSSLPSWAYYLVLNLTDAQASNNVVWNSTAPTSSVFTVGTGADQNGSGNTIVAYCFAPIAGYSAFGSYTGNGSTDGPFVFTGFRPRFVLIKCSSGSGAGWLIYDSARNTYNLVDLFLQANQSNAEAGNSTDNPLDFLSNGFKLRYSNTATNQSGETFIYMAFAESPFKYANAR